MTPVCRPSPDSNPPGINLSGPLGTRAQIAVMTCACAGASAFLFAVDPNRHAVYPQCLLYRATGLYCAGCGATRALYALLHGRVLQALHDNVLFVAALPFLLGFAGVYLVTAWHRNAWPEWAVQPRPLLRSGVWIFLLMLLFMAVRNLPGWPFELLKPL
jgi:Protein of unknown function (DUF2752)